VDGEAQLVELGAFDRADGLLDADADQVGRGDVAGTDGAGLPVDVGAVIEHRRPALPVAVEGRRHVRPEHLAQAFGVAGAFVQHVARRVWIDPDQPQDRPPRHQLPAKTAEMAGMEVWVTGAGHCFDPQPQIHKEPSC
jgi:hypothetical protein